MLSYHSSGQDGLLAVGNIKNLQKRATEQVTNLNNAGINMQKEPTDQRLLPETDRRSKRINRKPSN